MTWASAKIAYIQVRNGRNAYKKPEFYGRQDFGF